MIKELNIKEVQKINETLQKVDPGSLSENPGELYQLCLWCAAQKSFTGEQQAIAKKIWQDSKKKAYQDFILSNEANQSRVDKYGVLVVKDYINSKCGNLEAQWEYCERTGAACDLMAKSAMTVISSLKSERQTFNG